MLYNNTAYIGGGVYLDNPENMDVSGNIFNMNYAYNNTADYTTETGLGGGMYYTCTSAYKCNVYVRN